MGSEQVTDIDILTAINAVESREQKCVILQEHVTSVLKMVMESDGRKIEPGLDDDVRELGMTSKHAIEVKSILYQNLRVKFGFNGLLQCYTVREITETLIDMLTDNMKQREIKEKETRKELMKEDFVLWPHIQADAPPTPLSSIRNFLLTGATGNLAPYLLRELTKRENTIRVYCLIRGSIERLVNHLREIDILDQVDMTKVEVIEGDITFDQFDLDDDTWDRLAMEVDAVINCAASTNHLAPYAQEHRKYGGVRAVNTIGTQRILEFACAEGKTKWVYQASTMLAIPPESYRGGAEEWLPDFTPKAVDESVDNWPNFGYAISKTIADQLCHQASKRGIPCKVFRFPKVGGDERIGKQKVMDNHFFCKFLHYMVSGVLPDIDIPLLLLSVDTSARVSLRVFFDEKAKDSDIYNVITPYDISELDIAKEIGDDLLVPLRVLARGRKLIDESKGEEVAELVDNIFLTLTGKSAPNVGKQPGKWGHLKDLNSIFTNPEAMEVLKTIYGYPIRIVPWEEFKADLQTYGNDSLIAPWIDFYTSPDSIFQLVADGKIPQFPIIRDIYKSGPRKLENLIPELTQITENPMDVLKREVKYVIDHATEVFGYA